MRTYAAVRTSECSFRSNFTNTDLGLKRSIIDARFTSSISACRF
jgi:hypothetical protein